MPFTASGTFVRVSNSFSNPVAGTVIDDVDADTTFDDWDAGLTQTRPQAPVVVTGSSAVVAATTSVVVIQRASPATTGLTLGAVSARLGLPLLIVDLSTSVTSHVITVTPNGSEKIALQSTLVLTSTASQLAHAQINPSVDVSGWYVAAT
jgi:hypothetical protein